MCYKIDRESSLFWVLELTYFEKEASNHGFCEYETPLHSIEIVSVAAWKKFLIKF